MSTTTPPVPIPVRLDVDTHAATFAKAMAHLDKSATRELDDADIDAQLREFVRIRASQLNGCAYCVDMHTTDAVASGASAQRVNAVAIWRESPFFTARERAALAFTEDVTLVAQTHVPDESYAAIAEQFDADEIGALLSLIVTINAWNALSVASRAWAPELKETTDA